MAFRPPGRGPTPPLSYAHDLGQAGLGAGREAGRPCVLASDVTFSYCCVIVASSNTQLCCVVYHASLPASQFLTHHIAVVCCMLYATPRCPQHTHSTYLYMGYHASSSQSQFLTHHIAVVCCMLYVTPRCPQHTHSTYLCMGYHASLPASQFLTHHIAVVCCMLYATTRCPQHTHSAYLYMGSVVGHHTPHARWLGASRQSVLEFQKRSPRRSGLTVA